MRLLSTLLLFLTLPAAGQPAFEKELAVLVASATPHAVTGAYPTLRSFFIVESTAIRSATTVDGVTFVQEAGARLTEATVPALDVDHISGCSILPLAAGGFRMLYSAIGATGLYRIFSATSTDGLAWANDGGTRIEIGAGTTLIGSPTLVKLKNGTWRIYYTRDFTGGQSFASQHIYSALSVDEGLTWGTSSRVVASEAAEVGTSTSPLTNGKIRLVYTTPTTGTGPIQIRSVISDSELGNSFLFESGIRLSTPSAAGRVASPLLVRTTDYHRWRLYYSFQATGAKNRALQSAATFAPAPGRISPNQVFRNSASTIFTIAGDVFAAAATVKITRAGEADIAGTAVTNTDDQNITASFDPSAATLGLWNVVVTNANGQTGTLSNGILIDFASGFVNLTDNLLRPGTGMRTRVATTIFKPGRLTIKIYTPRGELIETILDQELPPGTHTAFWNGKTSRGSTVASGVYLLRAVGPRLDEVKKIVVVK